MTSSGRLFAFLVLFLFGSHFVGTRASSPQNGAAFNQDKKAASDDAPSSPASNNLITSIPALGRDPNQPVDQDYSRLIKQYTTKPFFNSPLTDYLPASQTVPSPKLVLGDVAGAPGILPYTDEVNRYMRMLEKASPRVKVYSIGKSEEGREMIALAVSSESNLSHLEENRARLARLADPRTINLNDAQAEQLVTSSVPVYYITGTIHSVETGAPTALMELAYRLAVDESAYIKSIRDNVITLITPVVETDGRDRAVDLYKWHLAHPKEVHPPLIYWGHYVAHDNNRDAMALTLNLSRNVLNTYLNWKAQVIHDLHESVPYLYDNTVGDEPYNAWLDPILTNEWQIIGWNNVAEMTKFGMPGVFTHGTFDTWSPGYLMFMAATHNGISRLYETFGNGGADTEERTLTPREYSRTWYRQNPPLPKALWSQRDNNNYEETGLLVSLAFFSENSRQFLRNFYLKSKRSIEKPGSEGPAAYVFPADDPRPGAQAELLRLLQHQGCEISRATAAFSAPVPARKTGKQEANASEDATEGAKSGASASDASAGQKAEKTGKAKAPEMRRFGAGTYIVRMDQPYSRIADMLLDLQYWSPNDPQIPYDDTAWSFGELGNVQVVRLTDAKVLSAPMERVTAEVRSPGGVEGKGQIFVVNHNADNALASLRFRLSSATVRVAEEPFEAAGHKFNRGSFVIDQVSQQDLNHAASELGVRAWAINAIPPVKTHQSKIPRIAFMHTWLSTQDEGWWRLAFDQLGVPYSYISTQDASKDSHLRDRFDVILFAPIRDIPQLETSTTPQIIISGLPMYRNALPWQTTPLTPNIGKISATGDMRPGLGWSGVANLEQFVRRGGVLISVEDTAEFALAMNFAPGVSTARASKLKAPGSILMSRFVDRTSPVAYGYGESLPVFFSDGPIFNLSNLAMGRGGEHHTDERPTGRGSAEDADVPQGRPYEAPPNQPHSEPWEAPALRDEQKRNSYFALPPDARPRVVLRYADEKDLLISGLLDGGSELAQHAAVVDVPLDEGHVILFSNNPFWRGETEGSYFLVLNAIVNWDNLNAGRK